MNGDRWIAGTRLGAQGHGAAGRTEGLDVKQGSEFRGLRVADLTGHGRRCLLECACLDLVRVPNSLSAL